MSNPDDNAKKEQAEAAASLESILKSGKGHQSSKPRDFKEGLGTGVSNIIAGAVGAAGVAVLAPTVGLAAGTKQGGIVGGAIGLAGGAVVGALGAVGLAVGGAVSGVSQIVQGTMATPAAMKARSKGMWWNEVEGRWISTDINQTAEEIKDIPIDDKDILEKHQEKLDSESVRPDVAPDQKKTVVDTKYYDVLEVDPNAEASAIKRKYYVLARKYHPDKVGKDDIESANKFKDIAEAYQVLSDPELRARYDKEGLKGLSADRTDVADVQARVDPTILFSFLFGSDQFRDYVGRLATATSASIGDSDALSREDARLLQSRRCKRLAVTMAVKLQNWVDAAGTKEAEEACKTRWMDEAKELSKASYGIQMVRQIGQVYTLTATHFLGSADSGIGMPSIAKWASSQQARMKKESAGRNNAIDGLKSGIDMMKIQADFEQKMKNATTEPEKLRLVQEMEKAAAEVTLKMLWTTLVVDITSTIHETVQMVFFDQSVDKKIRKRRAEGLKAMGQTFMDCPQPEKPEGEQEKDAQKIYEEAAFQAMLETMKRKDESQFNAATGHT